MRFACLFSFAALAGCGSGTTPMMPDMTAPPPNVYTGDEVTMVPADFSCLGTRMDPAAPTMDTPIMGVIKDFQDSNLVVGAVIKVYASAADVPANPIATSMPSDAMGNWSVTVPKGHYRVIFGNDSGMAITSGGTMVATIPTYEFDRVYSDHDRTAVKASTRDVIQGLVSVVPDPALGVIAGSVRDCANKETGGATVAVSGTSTAYDSASLLFYFKDVSGTTLPNRNQKWTTALGLFAALNVPVGSATATATGQVQESAPKELGAATVPILSGAITIVDVLPLGP